MAEPKPPKPQFTFKKDEPDLADVLDLLKKTIFFDLNCHHVATIQSFDPVTQTCTATINYKKSFWKSNSKGVYQQVLLDYPILGDVPVFFLRGGVGSFTAPVAKGDQALIAFNDRSIDNWFIGGSDGTLSSSRAHALSDGMAFVGFASKNNPLADFSSDHAEVRYGQSKVSVGEKIAIENASKNLKDILDTLMGYIKDLVDATSAITVICATPGNPSSTPVNVADILAIKTHIDSTITQLGELLE